ncbi:winged helix-turn-helix transcriptional regulator [Vagococcus salmoninarum]|uniref:winged helix-turn-helix transcriptional regulator n=1 Tax=Vagococcus salmoninarum TaxID=2739 RepID=UPI00187E8B5F|nr:helix-turn-helix domain-containing protein [Vagococcus salmoninarum]MBE9388331.1 helix-turn-helix transcriptional regulator [Vagococcus salmoninarum]
MYLNEFDATMQLIQGKWKIYILYDIHENKVARFNQLSRSIKTVANKTLTNQLRELENDGLISRHVYPQVPPKVEYSLTKKGQSLIPVLDVICNWGLANVPEHELKEILCTD